jgi:hypothetical protein
MESFGKLGLPIEVNPFFQPEFPVFDQCLFSRDIHQTRVHTIYTKNPEIPVAKTNRVSFRYSFGKLGLPIEVNPFFQPEFPVFPCKW